MSYTVENQGVETEKRYWSGSFGREKWYPFLREPCGSESFDIAGGDVNRILCLLSPYDTTDYRQAKGDTKP